MNRSALSHRYQIIARSTPDIKGRWEDLTSWAKHQTPLSWKGGKPSQEALINALVLWLDQIPDRQRYDLFREGLGLLDQALSEEGPERENPVRRGDDMTDPKAKRRGS